MTKSRSRFFSYAAISFVMIMWGLSFLSIKVTVNVIGPMTLALSRFVIASILLFAVLKYREPGTKLEKSDLPLMALSGIVGITIYFFFENNGVNLTTASTASIIIATIPMLTAVADYIFCGNKISLPQIIGVIMSFAGVYLIVNGTGNLNVSSKHFTGNLLMLGAAVSWVVYNLTTRPLGKKYSRLAITTYQTLFGTAAIIPFVFFEKPDLGLMNGIIAANIVFLGVFCSAAGYLFYVYSIGELGVSITSLFINLIPIITVIASYFILDEKITSTQLMGGGIIVAAVYLADINQWLKGLPRSQSQNVS